MSLGSKTGLNSKLSVLRRRNIARTLSLSFAPLSRAARKASTALKKPLSSLSSARILRVSFLLERSLCSRNSCSGEGNSPYIPVYFSAAGLLDNWVR